MANEGSSTEMRKEIMNREVAKNAKGIVSYLQAEAFVFLALLASSRFQKMLLRFLGIRGNQGEC